MNVTKRFWGFVFIPLVIGFLLQPPPPPTPTPTATPVTPSPTPSPAMPTPTYTPVPSPTPTPVPGGTPTPGPAPREEPKCLSALEGIVLDAETGDTLPGIVVELRGGGWKAQTVTDSEGRFRFYGLCFGVGQIYVPGLEVIEGGEELFFDGRNTLSIKVKAAAVKPATPTPTPTPPSSTGLPSTGWGAWLLPLGLLLGIIIIALRRLRHYV